MAEKIVLSRGVTPVPCARRTEPTRHLYDGHEPVDLHHTDVAATFERAKAQRQQSPNVKPLRKKSQG